MKASLARYACLLLLALSALGYAQPRQITFMGWGAPSEQKVFRTLIDSFEKNTPDIEVDYILVPPGDFLQKLTTLAAANDLPDVFYVSSDWFSEWVSRDLLLPIDDYVDPATLEKVWSEALALYRYDGEVVGQGSLYALPKDLGPWVMVYNKDLFDKYSIPYPATDGSWTWDQALEAWQKMTVANADGAPETFGVGDFTLEAAVWSNGADFLNADRTRVTVDDPKFTEALQFVADLSCKHHVSPTQSERASQGTYDMWIQGKLGTHVMGPWDQPTFWELPFNWDIAPFPTSPTTKQPASWTGSVGFAVSAQSEHPEDAVALASYFSTNEEGQRLNYELGQAVPNLIDMAQGEFLEVEKPPEHRQVFLDNITTWGRPTLGWYTSNDEWINAMFQEMAPVWNCETTAEEWGTSWAPELTEVLNDDEQIPSILPEEGSN